MEYMVNDKPASKPAPVGAVSSPARASPRKSHQFRHRYNPVRDSPSNLHRRNAGVRRTRRSENMNFLLSLAESEDGVDTINLTELVEPTVTAFSELFMQHEKMKVWNDFINRTEEDQEELLHMVSKNAAKNSVEEGASAEEETTNVEEWEDLGDNRTVHPAYTAEDCFKRIDTRLRGFLRRRTVPKGTLEYLEADITSFFHDWPSSILVSKLSSSFERLMLHALCQYLDLRSHSFDDEDGIRQTEIENKHSYFTPPVVTLTQYLEAKD